MWCRVYRGPPSVPKGRKSAEESGAGSICSSSLRSAQLSTTQPFSTRLRSAVVRPRLGAQQVACRRVIVGILGAVRISSLAPRPKSVSRGEGGSVGGVPHTPYPPPPLGSEAESRDDSNDDTLRMSPGGHRGSKVKSHSLHQRDPLTAKTQWKHLLDITGPPKSRCRLPEESFPLELVRVGFCMGSCWFLLPWSGGRSKNKNQNDTKTKSNPGPYGAR